MTTSFVNKHSTILRNWPNDWAVLWVLICTVHLTVCSYHATYEFQNIHEHSDIYLQLCKWDDYPLTFNCRHVITRLLLVEIYHTLEFRIQLNVKLILLVDIISDLITAISYKEAVDLNSYQPSSLTTNEMTNQLS